MKYFNLNGIVFAFESDGSQDDLITPDMVEMTQSEIDAHISQQEVKATPVEQLTMLDSGMPRVTEDLITLLVNKGVITLSELPQAAQDKLSTRANLRAQL